MKIRIVTTLVLLLVLIQPAAAQPPSDYVIATHYPMFGGTDPAPNDLVQARYQVYNNRETDYFAVSAATVADVAAQIQEDIGRDVVILNRWNDIREGIAALQIVNNVPIQGALYTIFLPPGWTRAAKLPVVLSANGAGTSNNDRLYGDPEIILPTIVGSSTQGGADGLIGAMSNAGGTESQGIDEATYRSVGAFFDWIDGNGGDKRNVVTAGGSRGGGTALMWAINPLDLDYEVHTVFAEVPPTHYGTLSQVSPLTFPSMNRIGTLVSGDPDAWRYDNDGLRPGLNPSPFMEMLIGTGVPAEADARSPIGLAEKLAGKGVVISYGAHDAFFPLAPFLAFDRRLTELGIPHGTFVTLASGHEANDFWLETVFLYLQGLSRGIRTPLPSGRFTFIDVNPAADDEMPLGDFFRERGIEADPTELPVIAQFPYRAGVGNPIDVVICGTPGDAVELTAVSAAGDSLYSYSGTLDASECHSEQVIVSAPAGVYVWALLVNGETINPRSTPTRGADGCGIRAVTTITDEQPAPDRLYAFNRDMSFGLDEYSGQPDYCGG